MWQLVDAVSCRVSEMTVTNERMKIQLIEKEKTIQALNRSVTALESRQAIEQSENETAKALREETEDLHAALRYLTAMIVAWDWSCAYLWLLQCCIF